MTEVLKKPLMFLVYFIGLLVATYIFMKFIVPYFTPFIIAIILAFIIDPFVNILEKWKVPRSIAVIILLGILVIVLSFLTINGIFRLTRELEDLAANINKYGQTVAEWLNTGIDRFEELTIQLPGVVTEALNDRIKLTSQAIGGYVTDLLNMIRFLPNVFVVLIISIIATYFISKDKGAVFSSILQIVPEDWQKKAKAMKTEIAQATVGFIRAQLILMFISTVIAYIGLTILGIRYAILLALIIGLVDFVPSVGPGIIFFPWALYSVFVLKQTGMAVVFVIIYILILVVRQSLQPKLVGEGTGIHPLLALASIYLGIKLFGVVGMFIGPFVAIILKAIVVGFLIPHI
jgi:sporulation integral membrane protein YtvI